VKPRPTPVLIAGAGPVGLTLAIDLGRRGIACTLVEQKAAPQFLPKMERCNARTMEIYRRIGIGEKVRAAGLPADVPMDIFIVLSLAEPALVSFAYPSVDAARVEIRACNDGSMPLEPYQLISQYTLEPLLKSIAQAQPNVTVRYGCELVSFTQDHEGVTAEVRNLDGTDEAIRAAYLVGCDGASSTVRRKLAIKLRGEYNILELKQALFRCDSLFGMLPMGNGPGKGRHYHVADENGSFMVMQDSTRHFTLHSVVESEAEMPAIFERTIGRPVPYELISVNPWRQNLLLAERYGDRRVFLAGDAVHLVIPTGGLGMNSGVGDAIDLSWKLAATLQGWGGPNLLASYEPERRQIGDRNVGASRYATLGRRKWRKLYRPNIRDKTPDGAATRAAIAGVAEIEQRKAAEMIGAELGYRYVDSPIICDVPGGPEHSYRVYEPTTWPGARLPHVWLDDGTPIQDRIPDGYTILRLGGTRAETTRLAAALSSFGAPVATLDIPDAVARDIYGVDLILLRPDMHVVWRGDRLPDDALEIAATATGHPRA
jgi:2-polyprenyl-6-methoxyphenol hydroxylase-like FAD-dependent oxidoreductase